MKRALETIRHFVVSEDGPTAVEYAVMLALIIVVAAGAVLALGTAVSEMFDTAVVELGSGGGGGGD